MGVLIVILIIALVICIALICYYAKDRYDIYSEIHDSVVNDVKREYKYQIEQSSVLQKKAEILSSEIAEKKIVLSALEESINSLKESTKPHREQFTNFFNAVKKQYGNSSFSSDWHADAFVSLFSFYVNHYEEIEKKLSSFVPASFKESKTDIVDHVLKCHANQPTISNIQFDVSATAVGSHGNYTTTLSHCSCKDFEIRKRPCKHMIALSRELDLSWIFGWYIRSEIVRTLKFVSLTSILTTSEPKQQSTVLGKFEKPHETKPQYERKMALSLKDNIPKTHEPILEPKLPEEILAILQKLDKE